MTLDLFGRARPAAPATPTPPAIAPAAGSARPEATRRPEAMRYLDVPISGLSDLVLRELDRLGPGWSWGRDEAGNFFVEDGAQRVLGRSLLDAVRVALQARRITETFEEDEP